MILMASDEVLAFAIFNGDSVLDDAYTAVLSRNSPKVALIIIIFFFNFGNIDFVVFAIFVQVMLMSRFRNQMILMASDLVVAFAIFSGDFVLGDAYTADSSRSSLKVMLIKFFFSMLVMIFVFLGFLPG